MLLLAAAAGVAGYRVRTVQLNSINYLMMRDVAGYYDMSYGAAGDNVAMRSKTRSLQFTMDKREAKIDGVSVNLAFASLAWRGGGVISENDFRLMLEPILRPSSLPKQTIRTIVIDPGHGGKDQGAASRRYLEKDLNYRVARLTADGLRKLGYTVYLTRSSPNATLELDQRNAILDRVHGDLFISIHSNSAADHDVNGVETFLVTPSGAPSTNDSKAWAGSRKRGNQFDRYNTRLVWEIHRSVLQATGAADRGIKHANFAVLREASCPALLVEIGFLSNAREEAKIGSPEYQTKVATGIVNGVRAYDLSAGQAGAKAGVKK